MLELQRNSLGFGVRAQREGIMSWVILVSVSASIEWEF